MATEMMMVIYLSLLFFFQFLDGKRIKDNNDVEKFLFLRNHRETCESYRCYLGLLSCSGNSFCVNCCLSGDYECVENKCYTPGGPFGGKDQVAKREDPVAKRKYPTTQMKDPVAKIKDQAAKLEDSAAKREVSSNAVEKMPFLRDRRQTCESYKCDLGLLTCKNHGNCVNCCGSSDYHCIQDICHFIPGEPNGHNTGSSSANSS